MGANQSGKKKKFKAISCVGRSESIDAGINVTRTQVLDDEILNDPAYHDSAVAQDNSYRPYVRSPHSRNNINHYSRPGAHDSDVVVNLSGVKEPEHDENYYKIDDLSVKSETEVKKLLKNESSKTKDFHHDRVHYVRMIKIFQPLLLITVKVRHLIPYLPFLSDSRKVLAIEAQNPRVAMMYLLDELSSHRHMATQNWQHFVSALEKCGYRYIVEVLTATRPVDHTYQREYLRIVSPILRQFITPSKLTTKLWAADVITCEEKDAIARIEKEKGPVHATDSLLECLPRNHKCWYLHFIDALTENKVIQAVEILDIAEMKQYGGHNESVKQRSSSFGYLNMNRSEETACKQLVESSEDQYRQSVNDTMQIKRNDNASSETYPKQVITTDESPDSISEWDLGNYEPPMPPFAAPNSYKECHAVSYLYPLEDVNDVKRTTSKPFAITYRATETSNDLECQAYEFPLEAFAVVKETTLQPSAITHKATETNYENFDDVKDTTSQSLATTERDPENNCDLDCQSYELPFEDFKDTSSQPSAITERATETNYALNKPAPRHQIIGEKPCSIRKDTTYAVDMGNNNNRECAKDSAEKGKHPEEAIASGRKSLYYSEPFRSHRGIEAEDIFVTLQNPPLQQRIPNRSLHVIDEEKFLKNNTYVSKQKKEEEEVHRLIEILNICGQERQDVSLKSNLAIKDVTSQNLNPSLRSKLEKVRDLEDKLESLMYDEQILRRKLKLQDDINEILKRNRTVSSELSLKEKEGMALEAATESGGQETEADLYGLQQELNNLDTENITSAHAAVTTSTCIIAEDLQMQAAGKNEKECTDLYKDSAFCSQYKT